MHVCPNCTMQALGFLALVQAHTHVLMHWCRLAFRRVLGAKS